MPTPITPALTISTTWEHPVVDAAGGEAALVVTIAAPEQPAIDRPRTPIDVAFVLDRSGSMTGEKLTLVKRATDVALDHLSPQDRVALVIYDDQVDTLHPLAPATADVKATIRHRLAHVEAGGTTYLSGGWLAGCRELAEAGPYGETITRPRRAILLTDGLANVGITDDAELAKHATELRLRGITTTTVGVGLGFDEMLLSAMAEAGGGAFQFIAHPRELGPFFSGEIADLLSTAATRVRLRLTMPHGMHATLVNAFPAEREGKTISVDLRDFSAGETIKLVFDVQVAPGPLASTLELSARLSWTAEETRHRITTPAARLTRAPQEVVNATPRNDDAAAIVALEQAAKSQREAIELDRQGRYAESRNHYAASQARLMSAPQTADVMAEQTSHAWFASAPLEALPEADRKQQVSRAARRSRGHRDHTADS
jgi:Ca-activated chloride channel family protein